ncbi:MAG: response regulator [Herpetosiphonaceae bacterium]|nr:MAG: response regulator [Herpetosiphonaceae bacterium]
MKTVLVVDDSATMRRMVIASLRHVPDINFAEAGSGLEALEWIALAPVDLLILDLNMPDMHGLDVLRFLRSHHTYNTTPVVVLTTKGDESSHVTALAAGASHYLTKPFIPQTLSTYVRELLGIMQDMETLL